MNLKVLFLSFLTLTTLGVAPVAGTAFAQEDELVIVSTGGTLQDALETLFFEPFTSESDTRITHVSAFTSEQFDTARTMKDAGDVEWDIVTAQPESFFHERDLLEELDCSRIPNAAEFGIENTCTTYGLLRTIGGGVIAYNTDAFPDEGPSSWVDFWDVERFPGQRCLPAITPHWMIMIALMADGVDPDQLFPLDIDRGVSKLEELKPNVSGWWETGNESQDMMRQGDCVMAWMWSGRALQLMREGHPIAISWNQHLPIVGYWAILKDAPNKDAAYDFLNFFMARPEAHRTFSETYFYDTANRIATEQLSQENRKLRVTSPENLAEQAPTDFQWIAEHQDEMRQAFDSFLNR